MIDGAGTSEHAWLPFLDGLDLPELDLTQPPDRVVVVAPHPDDEVLGVGGLLALLAAAGTSVHLLAVTDGEASNPAGSLTPREMGARRVGETSAALAALGVPAHVDRLALPDGGAAALEQPVLDALDPGEGSWLLGPWEHDGHPDHDAVGRACRRAADRAGTRLLAYPVWAWHWALPNDPRLPWARALRIDLPDRVRRAKERAVDAFETQVRAAGPLPGDAPVLPPDVLSRFGRGRETVFA